MFKKEDWSDLFAVETDDVNTSPGLRDAYKKVEERYDRPLKEAIKEHFIAKISNSNKRTRTAWQVVKNICGRHRHEQDLEIEGDPIISAERFNHLFIGIA
ncbi:hypothetical protein HHI36_013444, partial [Cryptolaemus montrouzieri]